MKSHKILLIDDDVSLTKLLSQYLQQSGFVIRVNNDPVNIEHDLAEFRPDLIILDVVLPNANGLEICSRIRETYHEPIIMFTALDDDIDEVTGLEMGADVYLSKPLKPRVLLAYVRAHLRRYTSTGKNEVIVSGELSIDHGAREVKKNGSSIDLTTAEFDLLWLLAIKKGKAVSREDLYKKIYHLEFDGIDRSIDLRISRLRKKLGQSKSNKPYILTIRNAGYQLSSF